MTGMITFDTATRRALTQLAKDIFSREREEMNEVWLTKEEFLKQFGMFTEDWLKRYGHLLRRVRVTVTDAETGKVRASQYAYARNEMQRLIAEDRLEFVVGKNGKVRGRG